MATRQTSKASNKKNQPQTKPGIGCLIWLVMFIITLLLFVLNWDTIQQTLKDTRFFEAIKRDAPSQPLPSPPPVINEPQQSGDGSAQPSGEPSSPRPTTAAPNATSEPAATAAPESTSPSTPENRPNQPPTGSQPSTPITPVEQIRQTRVAALYFVQVDDDGTISRRQVKRTISSSDSPLTDSLQALLRGPSADELNQNLITLIPSGTRLLSAQVRGATAYLNFSEDFMYNRYGIEGYAGQLKQIIFTATEFTTVKDVFFLIEGQARDYLGGEGVYIGKPLSRSSF